MGRLSKSKLIAFRQCPKRLWLEIHHPELREDSEATQASYRVGHTVGEVAKRIFDPAGTGCEINAQRDGYQEAFERSAELLADPRQPVFEAGLQTPEALAFADVMLPDAADGIPGWRMIEVKSATRVHDYHRDDIAIQTFIARASGVTLKSVSVACVDSTWVYPGGGHYDGLLALTDLTSEAVARDGEVRAWIGEAQKVASLAAEPEVKTGDHCHEPFECGFCQYCSRGQPQPEFPLDWLPRFSATRRAELGQQGIDDLRQVPDEVLNAVQQRVKQHTLAGTPFFDATGAAADLEPHGLPARFLDFETVQLAVPIWPGTRPYEQIPFQFSLHTWEAAGTLTQTSFLDLTGDDPSRNFTRALLDACGGSGPVFVYNAAFESARMRALAVRFPEYEAGLSGILARLVDLLPIARERYYHPSQKGSWSIKAVLPAAVPGLSYEALPGVKDGAMAMEAYFEATRPETSAERKAAIERQLRAYCELDTLAMVRLWEFFAGKQSGSTLGPRMSDLMR